MSQYLSWHDFLILSPFILLLCGSLFVLIGESFFSKWKKLPYFMTLITFLSLLVTVFYIDQTDNILLTTWLKTDNLNKLFMSFFTIIGIASAVFANSFFNQFEKEKSNGEYYFLLIAAVFGLILIGAANDFLIIFLGLETLSISLYILCGYMKKWNISHESAIKYFLLGSLGTAFFLYGIALIYGALKTTNLEALLFQLSAIENTELKTLFLVGVALVTLGLLFKAAIVPFHTWAPDVYEGATTPLTAFMAVGTKAGAFAAFIRIFLESLSHFNPFWNKVMALLFFPTVIYANFLALKQKNLRRFFAYSGISHAGYLLIPLIAGGNKTESIDALFFYLVVYALATLAAFAVLVLLDREKKGLFIENLSGLFYKKPALAAVLALSLLTLAGIPPTVGFFAKFYLFKLAYQAGFFGVLAVGLIMTVFAAYYYLRIIVIMLTHEPHEEAIRLAANHEVLAYDGSFVIGIAAAGLLLLFSLLPNLLYNII